MRVSIGICAYNEENNIGSLLENLLGQAMPSRYDLKEIIVISSGCTDRTEEIVNRIAQNDPRVKLITEKKRSGKAHALNNFFNNAKGDILVVVSADTQPEQGSLAEMICSMKPGVGGACATTLPSRGTQSTMAFCNSFLWKVHNRLLHEKSKKGTLRHLGGDMWAIRREAVQCLPCDVINDDAFLGIALHKKGWQIVHVPAAQVMIKGPETPMEYLQQRERIIVGHRQVKELTGVEPSTIGALALKSPGYSLGIIVSEIRLDSFSDYPKILLGLSLEAMAQIVARINYGKKTDYLKWKQIRSTKNL